MCRVFGKVLWAHRENVCACTFVILYPVWRYIMELYSNFLIQYISFLASDIGTLSALQEMPSRCLCIWKMEKSLKGSTSKYSENNKYIKKLSTKQEYTFHICILSSFIDSGLFIYLFGVEFNNTYDAIGHEMQSPRKYKCIQIILPFRFIDYVICHIYRKRMLKYLTVTIELLI